MFIELASADIGIGSSELNIANAEALLRDLAASTIEAKAEVGQSGQAPHNYAFLRLTSPSDADKYAVISTPGDGWFQLEVNGGFLTGTTSDLTTDAEVRELLEPYVAGAIAYLDGRWSTGKSRLLKVPFIILKTDDGPIKLRGSVGQTLKQALKR